METLIICSIVILVFLVANAFWAMSQISEVVEEHGPLIWGFWGCIRNTERFTILFKVILIGIGFPLYLILGFLTLRWLKPLFIKY